MLLLLIRLAIVSLSHLFRLCRNGCYEILKSTLDAKALRELEQGAAYTLILVVTPDAFSLGSLIAFLDWASINIRFYTANPRHKRQTSAIGGVFLLLD